MTKGTARMRRTDSTGGAAAHPERRALAAAAQTAGSELTAAWRELADTHRRHDRQLGRYGALGNTDDPDAHLAQLERDVATTRAELDTARQQIGQLATDPAVQLLPAAGLSHEHDRWRTGYDTQREFARRQARRPATRADRARRPRLDSELGHQRQVDFGRGSGPSIGR